MVRAPTVGAIVPNARAPTSAAAVTHSFVILGHLVTAKLTTITAMDTWAISLIQLYSTVGRMCCAPQVIVVVGL